MASIVDAYPFGLYNKHMNSHQFTLRNMLPPVASLLPGFTSSFLLGFAAEISHAQSNPPQVQTPPASSVPPAIPSSQLPNTNTDSEAPDFNKPEGKGSKLGKYRVADGLVKGGRVKVKDRLTDTYKSSVVRVIARDESGNILNQAMGVSIGVTANNLRVGDSNYIATPLSLVLGNTLQWADQIEVQQDNGASLKAKVALIDEQIDLVLLKPEISPSPLRFIPAENERPRLNILTLELKEKRDDSGAKIIVAEGHEGVLAAMDSEKGTLTVSGRRISNRQAGTAIINLQGQLLGMLLPNSRGILSSRLKQAVSLAKGKRPFHPRLVGAIMGRGVLVDPRLKDAYKSIPDALQDIADGKAPKADTKLYLKAHTDELKPKDPPRSILKVAPGEYELTESIVLPSNISVSGSGAKDTILRMTSANKPVVVLDNVKNITVANFRILPGKQEKAIASVRIRNSQSVVLLGNLIQADQGRAVHFTNSQEISIFGNTFPKRTSKNILKATPPKDVSKGIYCQASTATVETNAFLEEWPQSLAVGKSCHMLAERNIFIRNQISIAVSSQSTSLELKNNTFVGSKMALRFFGKLPEFVVEDNLFYRNKFSILSQLPLEVQKFGRNGAYQSVAFQDGKMVPGLDFVKGKPEFRKPDKYDFRLLPGSPNVGAGIPGKNGIPTDIGAFQPSTYLGKHTSHLIDTLSLALESENLSLEWGFEE